MKRIITIILSLMLVLAITSQAAALSTVAVKSIKLDTSSISLKVGQSQNLKVSFTPANTTQKVLSYVTTNKNVAIVSKGGKISAVGKGKATVTVYTMNKAIYAKCSVTVAEATKISGKLEVFAFVNGDKMEGFFNYATDQFKKLYPNVKVTTVFKPDIRDILRPRFVAGNPPDVISVMGPATDDFAKFAQAGEYSDLTSFFNTAEAIGYDGTIKDNLAFYQQTIYNGKSISAPYFYGSANGIYYNKKMAEKYGWTPPTNWDEFKALAPKIKAQGIYPFIYQGKYPSYIYASFLDPATVGDGGRQLKVDQANLVKGSFLNPAFVNGLREFEFAAKNDYFPQNCIGMTHTEAQIEFLNGKAFMIPCGTWLEGEMAKDVPDGFEFGFSVPFTQAKGHLPNFQPYCSNIVVPTKAKNKTNAYEFLRVLYSRDVVRKSVDAGVGPADMKETFDGIKVDPSVSALAKFLKSGEATGFAATVGNFDPYDKLNVMQHDMVTAIAQGSITADDAAKKLEALAQEIAADKTIPKVLVK